MGELKAFRTVLVIAVVYFFVIVAVITLVYHLDKYLDSRGLRVNPTERAATAPLPTTNKDTILRERIIDLKARNYVDLNVCDTL